MNILNQIIYMINIIHFKFVLAILKFSWQKYINILNSIIKYIIII